MLFIYLLSITVLIFIYFEIIHLTKPKSPLRLIPKDWQVSFKPGSLKANGYIEVHNRHKRMEVMIPSFKINPTLLSNRFVDNSKVNIKIIPEHPDINCRKDDYWEAYIVKSKKSTRINIELSFPNLDDDISENDLESLWINVIWSNYGPFGKTKQYNGFVVPISKPRIPNIQNKAYYLNKKILLIPIKTHILGMLDNPYDVISNYCSEIIQPGDILAIGETPLAIMQGRYVIPNSIKLSPLAKLLCRNFHPTSSLATAYGMQSLIDLIGPTRSLFSWFIGGISKLIGIKGIFYRLAGEQARLIDDITGTTPPYDQTIVLGPNSQKEFCNKSSNLLGIDIAIVDVNDLGKVKILQCNNPKIRNLLTSVLKSNPAGNANEHTPLVLIRSSNKEQN
tara:strand:+ start:102 stop:1280 length:1179 start_codon:yes stop_codon:yes gene_type:complete